jgi:hypothetical protein
MDYSPNGDPIMPNYNKETASDSLNRFVEILNKGSKYLEMGAVPPPGTPLPSQYSAFQMKGPETITGKVNGLLNVAPALGSVGKIFSGSNAIETFTQTYPSWTYQTALPAGPSSQTVDGFKGLNWEGDSGALLTTVSGATVGGFAGTQPISLSQASQVDLSSSGSNLFEYMTDTTFATFSSFVGAPPIAFNNSSASLLSITMSDAISAFCATGTACRDKLSHGDLVGFYEDIKSSLPEGVALR